MSAQRYGAGVAHDRMAANQCPECGEDAANHLADNRFWIPRNCDLMPQGVVDRIAQYVADQGANS